MSTALDVQADTSAPLGPAADLPARGDRTRFAFLAETSRCLADSLDLETTLATVAGLALPHFGGWCIVDVVEQDETITRLAVIHPDAEKQRVARDFYLACPPRKNDPIGAPRVIRTHHSEFAPLAEVGVLDALDDPEHRRVLQQLGAQSFLTVPLRARGRTLGAIAFVSEEQRHFDDADLLLAEDLGRRCAMAIDNARLYAAAEEARRTAESAREAATFAAQRANALRELADSARQDAEAANRAKAAFLTTMSHEFRTPLGAVLGFVGLLNDELAGPLTTLQRDYLRRIGNATGSLLRLIEEMLVLSQVNAGRGVALVEDTDVAAIVREVADMFHPLVVAKSLRLVVDAPQVPVVVATDGAKFRQIAINLVGNAVKFTDAGEVRMVLGHDDTDVVLRVRDTGRGIAPDEVDRLFEPFVQVGRGDRAKTQGTGLGLAISRELARLLGGDVSVESAPGEGSTFILTLPSTSKSEDPSGADRRAPLTRERRARGRANGH